MWIRQVCLKVNWMGQFPGNAKWVFQRLYRYIRSYNTEPSSLLRILWLENWLIDARFRSWCSRWTYLLNIVWNWDWRRNRGTYNSRLCNSQLKTQWRVFHLCCQWSIPLWDQHKSQFFFNSPSLVRQEHDLSESWKLW